MANPQTGYFALTGDNVIDGMTHGYFWLLDSTKTVDVSISNGFNTEYWNAPSSVAQHLMAALDTVSIYANIDFNYLGYYTTPSVAANNGSEINLSLSQTGVLFQSNSVWAQGFFPKNSYNSSLYVGAPGDIYININSAGASLPSYEPGSQGWFLLMHELLHTLGLKHPHDSGGTGRPTFSQLGVPSLDVDWATVMSYNDGAEWNNFSWDPATPMAFDVLALQYLYGKNTSFNTGNSIYTLSEQAYPYYYTLWDAGGIDTLDASLAASGWTITLPNIIPSSLVNTRVGLAAPSSAYSSGIAPNALVWLTGDYENVIGSTYADDIYGNLFSNTINSGLGNDIIHGGAGNDTIDGGGGIDTAVFSISTSAVSAFTRAPSGGGYLITSSEGLDTLTGIEYVQFQGGTYSMSDFYAFINSSTTSSSSSSTSSNTVTYAASFAIPVTSIQSIGLSPDGHYLLIKIAGVTQSVTTGSNLSFNGSTVSTDDLTQTIIPIPVFKSSGGTGGYALPDLFTGPASLGIKYQLIESADNAVVIGSTDNDFIKVASSNSIGKAVNGGGGNDVIDGGVGSTFVTGGTNHNTTFFLDGRAPGTSWSTITDFKAGVDKATIWGFVKGVSSIDTSFANYNNEGATGYKGLTLHFKNLLPDGQTSGSNANLNSITFSGHTLAELGASSLGELNNQINAGTNQHILVGSTQDSAGTHSYLYIH